MVLEGTITITITGLKECLAALNKVKQNLPQTRGYILEDVTSSIIREAKNRAHVITGNMKRSIGVQEINKEGGKAIVEAAAEYSEYENRRGAPHDFWDQAITTTEQTATAMVKRRMDELLRNTGVPTT